MKRILFICTLLVSLFAISGCSDDIDTPVLTTDEYVIHTVEREAGHGAQDIGLAGQAGRRHAWEIQYPTESGTQY